MYNNSGIETLKVRSPEDLPLLRRIRNCQKIEIIFDDLSRGNLPLYLFRYVIWALAEGAEATVLAKNTLSSTGIIPFRWSFRMVMQIAAKSIYPEGIISSFDDNKRIFTIKRIAPVISNQSWTAIVVFSGEISELPSLRKCLESLNNQPELLNDGQIIVCGPSYARDFIGEFKNIEYLVFDNDLNSGRILIAHKKNYAISIAKNENILICHTRILLKSDALKNMPNEFDCITPKVEIRSAKDKYLPYLDLGFIAIDSTSTYTESISPRIFYERKKWQNFLSKYYAYVDGAIFCVKRSTALRVPLNDAIAWGEGEDVEWCIRMQHNGRVVELSENSYAESQKNKHINYVKYGESNIMRILSNVEYKLDYFLKFLSRIVSRK